MSGIGWITEIKIKNMLDIIIQENEGMPDRHLLHKILANQHLIISKIAIFMATIEEV
jgi:hypothetical protein